MNSSDGSSNAAGVSRLGRAPPRAGRAVRAWDIAAVSSGIAAMNVTLLCHQAALLPDRSYQFPCQGALALGLPREIEHLGGGPRLIEPPVTRSLDARVASAPGGRDSIRPVTLGRLARRVRASLA